MICVDDSLGKYGIWDVLGTGRCEKRMEKGKTIKEGSHVRSRGHDEGFMNKGSRQSFNWRMRFRDLVWSLTGSYI